MAGHRASLNPFQVRLARLSIYAIESD